MMSEMVNADHATRPLADVSNPDAMENMETYISLHSRSTDATSQMAKQVSSPSSRPLSMTFSEFCKGPRSSLARLRQHQSTVPSELPATTAAWNNDEYADILSKDKAKQKEAIRRYLAANIKTDWEFTWPLSQDPNTIEQSSLHHDVQPTEHETVLSNGPVKGASVQDETREEDGYQADDHAMSDAELSESDLYGSDGNESVYSVVWEDNTRYRPRTEWESDFPDDEEPAKSSPARFWDPDSLGSVLNAASQAKRAYRRRQLRKESAWNEGLACFEARRNAWTGARTVRVRSKPVAPPPVSPRSHRRRSLFRRSISGSPPDFAGYSAAQNAELSGTTSDASVARDDKDLVGKHTSDGGDSAPGYDARLYPVETLLPIAQPILPPSHPLRAGIGPAVYHSLYDKIILHNLQPSCPINLSDMLRSCVAGWKRDGEWPPKPTVQDGNMCRKKTNRLSLSIGNENAGSTTRRMSFGILGKDREDGKEATTASKGFRRSLQRAFGLGPLPGLPGGNGAT